MNKSDYRDNNLLLWCELRSHLRFLSLVWWLLPDWSAFLPLFRLWGIDRFEAFCVQNLILFLHEKLQLGRLLWDLALRVNLEWAGRLVEFPHLWSDLGEGLLRGTDDSVTSRVICHEAGQRFVGLALGCRLYSFVVVDLPSRRFYVTKAFVTGWYVTLLTLIQKFVNNVELRDL